MPDISGKFMPAEYAHDHVKRVVAERQFTDICVVKPDVMCSATVQT